MIKAVAGLAVLLAVPALTGASWQFCVHDSAALVKAPVRGAMLKEFHALLGGRMAGVEFGRCADRDSAIVLRIKAEPPVALRGVLGLAYRHGSRIAPDLEVFYGPLVRYLGKPNNAHAVGRALARVAAHEAGHFLEQRAHHCARGLMREMLPAYELSAKDRWPFRQALSCGTGDMALAEPHLYGEAREARPDEVVAADYGLSMR